MQQNIQHFEANQKNSQQAKQKDPNVQSNKVDTQEIPADKIKVEEFVSDDEKTQQQNLQTSTQLKKAANVQFSAQQYKQAVDIYFKALPYLSTQDQQHKKMRAVIYSNIAISLSKMKQCNNSDEVIKYCRKAIKYDPQYYKAWLNLAKQYQCQSKWQEALEAYQQAQKIDKKYNRVQKFVLQKIAILQPKVNQINEKRKQQVLKGLKDIGNSVLGFFGMSLDQFKMQQNPGGGYNIAFKQ